MSISADPSHQQGQRVKGKALLANMFASGGTILGSCFLTFKVGIEGCLPEPGETFSRVVFWRGGATSLRASAAPKLFFHSDVRDRGLSTTSPVKLSAG